jgi:hypothetical protein
MHLSAGYILACMFANNMKFTRPFRIALTSLAFGTFSFVTSFMHAQLAASKNMTNGKDKTNLKIVSDYPQIVTEFSEDYANACSMSASEVDQHKDVKKFKEPISLSVLQASSAMQNGHPLLTLTVRLLNTSEMDVLIPWNESPVSSIQADPNDPTFSRDMVNLWAIAWYKSKNDGIVNLSPSRFWAQPRNSAHYQLLHPGSWAEITYSGTVNCGLANTVACERFESGKELQISAIWYERRLTHQRIGCAVKDVTYRIRELESSPIKLVPAQINQPNDLH